MKKGLCLILLTVLCGCSDDVKPVSEWTDVFDIDCVCGNHLHAEPCDLEHYSFACYQCGKIYEKGWDVWRKKLGKWKYVQETNKKELDFTKPGKAKAPIEIDKDLTNVMFESHGDEISWKPIL